MRIKSVLVGIAVAMMAVACSTESKEVGNDSLGVKPQEEVKDGTLKTFDDSVAYFMGQDAALAYWRAAKIDSTLSGKENAEQFRKGIEDGLKAATKSNAYAIGLQHGLVAFTSIKGLNDNLKTALSAEAFMKGLNMAMESENAVDAVKFQADMSEVEARLNTLMMQTQDTIK